MKPHQCPYKATINNQCSHKGTKPNRKSKRYCGYRYIRNCPLFLEWQKVTAFDEKIENSRRNTSNNTTGDLK